MIDQEGRTYLEDLQVPSLKAIKSCGMVVKVRECVWEDGSWEKKGREWGRRAGIYNWEASRRLKPNHLDPHIIDQQRDASQAAIGESLERCCAVGWNSFWQMFGKDANSCRTIIVPESTKLLESDPQAVENQGGSVYWLTWDQHSKSENNWKKIIQSLLLHRRTRDSMVAGIEHSISHLYILKMQPSYLKGLV